MTVCRLAGLRGSEVLVLLLRVCVCVCARAYVGVGGWVVRGVEKEKQSRGRGGGRGEGWTGPGKCGSSFQLIPKGAGMIKTERIGSKQLLCFHTAREVGKLF